MKTPFNGRRRGRKSYPASHDCSEGTMGHSLNSHQWDKGPVCVPIGRIAPSRRKSEIDSTANNDTGPASAPQDSLALLLEHLTGMHKFTTSRVLEFLRCGLPPQDHITWSTWKRDCVLASYSRLLSQPVKKAWWVAKDRSRCPTHLQEC